MPQSWTFIAAGTEGSGANPSPGIPAGVNAGDLLVLFCADGATAFSATPPTGWSGSASTVNSAQMGAGFYFKVASGSDTAPTVTNASTASTAIILAWRTIVGSAFDSVGAFSQNNANNTITAGSVNTTTPDDLVIHFFGSGATAATWTAPSGTSSRYNQASTASLSGLLITDEDQIIPGATVARTATLSASPSVSGVTVAFQQLQPTITVQPVNTVSPIGQVSPTFSVTATASAGTLTYQWFKNGGSIGGATSSSYSPPAQNFPHDYGNGFYCAVTDSNATINSNTAGVQWLFPRYVTRGVSSILNIGDQDYKSEITLLRWF